MMRRWFVLWLDPNDPHGRVRAYEVFADDLDGARTFASRLDDAIIVAIHRDPFWTEGE